MKKVRWIGIMLAISAGIWLAQMLVFPRVHSPFVWERLRATVRTNDQLVLTGIAMLDRDHSIRRAAVERLTDQAFLARIATKNSDYIIRDAAFKKLTNQVVLAQVATGARDASIREEAAERLTDQAVLAEIVFNDDHTGVRIAAVERLTSMVELTKLATNDSNAYVRKKAAGRLTDNAVLAQIATYDRDVDVRRAAVEGLTPEGLSLAAEQADDLQQRALLANVAKLVKAVEDVPVEHRQRILSETMPAVGVYCKPIWTSRFGVLITIRLGWFAESESYSKKRRFKKDITKTVDGEQITFTATFSATDEVLRANWTSFFQPAVLASTSWVEAHIQHVDTWLPWLEDDQAALAELSTKASSSHVRQVAVRKLTDQTTLAEVATNDSDDFVRQAAAERLAELRRE